MFLQIIVHRFYTCFLNNILIMFFKCLIHFLIISTLLVNTLERCWIVLWYIVSSYNSNHLSLYIETIELTEIKCTIIKSIRIIEAFQLLYPYLFLKTLLSLMSILLYSYSYSSFILVNIHQLHFFPNSFL